jgi:hypothetical protein
LGRPVGTTIYPVRTTDWLGVIPTCDANPPISHGRDTIQYDVVFFVLGNAIHGGLYQIVPTPALVTQRHLLLHARLVWCHRHDDYRVDRVRVYQQ